MRPTQVLCVLASLGMSTLVRSESRVLLPDATYGDGVLYQPEAVVETNGHELFVLDSGNHRIVVFDEEGEVDRFIGSIGSSPGRFLSPTGMDVDEDGTVIVADFGNQRVQFLDPHGEVLGIFDADGGLSDVLALGAQEYLMSRSFQRGRALFYRLRFDGTFVEFVGDRVGPADHVGLEVSLNTYRGTLVDGQLLVAFTNLSRVLRLRDDGSASWFDVSTPETDIVHASFHRKLLSGTEREEPCAEVTVESLRRDLELACSDGSRRFETYIAGIDGFAGRTFALTKGVIHEVDPQGDVLRRFELRTISGDVAFSHRFWIDDSGRCYTVDSFHDHIVRRYDLDRTDEAGAGELAPVPVRNHDTGD